MFVIGDDARTGLLDDRDRRDLGLEGAAFNGLAGAGQRLHRVFVLVGAGELIGFGGGFAEIAHRSAGLIGILQPVHHHVIDDAVMTGAIAAAGLGQQIGRVAHALHAAGQYDLRRAGMDDVVRQHGRLHAGATDLVDGGRAGGVGQFGAARRLAGGRLTLAGRQHIAHEDLVDPLRLQLCALQRRTDDVGTELMGRKRRQIAHEAAERGAGSGQNDDGIIGHEGLPGARRFYEMISII